MNRSFKALASGPFDLLVIGGGIYGAWTAYDAALRGMKVAIVEKGDWASGTSSASSKLLHGGLRYLEQFHFGLVRRSLDERRRLYRLARHQVTPLRFVIPMYRGARVGRLRLRAGLWLYDALAGGGQPVQRHGWLDANDVLEQYDFLSDRGLEGALTYGDCQIDDARFVLEIIDGAANAGAVALNYAQATSLIEKGGRVIGARIADGLGNDERDVFASVVVNAAGPWAPNISGINGAGALRLSKGVHLVMPAFDTNDAMLIMAKRDRRVFFIIPWYGRTLLGTTDSDYRGDLDDISVAEEDVDYLLGEANRILRTAWDSSMILGSFAGVRALKYEQGKSPDSVTREWVMQSPRERFIVSTGGKYTSARADAAEIVDRVTTLLGKSPASREPTWTRPSPWSPPGDFTAWQGEQESRAKLLGIDVDTARLLVRYGERAAEVLDLIQHRPELASRLQPELPFCRAEVVWAAQHTMVATLEDLVRRRLPLVVLCRPERQLLEAVADLVAPVLDWDAETRAGGIDRVMQKWSA